MTAADLAAAVTARRAELGLAQTDLADAGGPSHTTVRRIERGLGCQARALGEIDRALSWSSGTAAGLLAAEAASLSTEDARALAIGRAVLTLIHALAPTTEETP